MSIEKILGFNIIREKLAKMASSELGNKAIMQMELTEDIRIIMSDLDLVSEMKKIITSGSFPIHGIYDIENTLLSIVSENQLVDPVKLYHIGKTLYATREISQYAFYKKDIYRDIYEICDELEPFEDIEQVIFKAIDADGEILDSASSALKSIRNRITITENRIRSKVKNVLDAYKHAGYSRDEEITIRNGKLVVPVKAECRNRIKGIIHDESATGNTIFVEPFESLEINSELNKLYREEKREIERIIRTISTQVYHVREELLNNIEVLTELDVLYAKAKFSVKYDCSQVKVNSDNITNIYTGYHPFLIDKHGVSEVEPLDLEIGEKFSTLIITGPNAGGKTVALKTIGLFSLMIKAGMHIPAQSHSNLAIYKNIFADIGDNQSIENDLSTFSSNVKTLSTILRARERETLVLLDEIGASTDPAEGSALSMSILKEFTKRKYISVATTHQGVLKAFAYKTKGVENGSMEFDRKKISPTYRFRSGIPGSSYAFEIAKRHGLPWYVIRNAKNYLGSEKQNLENLISNLDEKLTKYNTLLRNSKVTNDKLVSLKESYDKKFSEIKKKEKEILRNASKRGEEIIRSANKLIENTISEIRSTKADKSTVKNLRSNLTREKEILSKKFKVPKEPEKRQFKGELTEGLEVKIEGFTNWGVIEKISGKNVEVIIGDMHLNIKKKKIIDIRQAKENKESVIVNVSYSEDEDFTGIRLDLRGMRGDAAIEKLEKHLEQMQLKNLHKVEIVHGKGTGILDKLVNQFLEKSPLVKSRKYGEFGEGDYGVTIAELK